MGQNAVIGQAVPQGCPDGLFRVKPSPNSGSSGMHLIAAPMLMNRPPGLHYSNVSWAGLIHCSDT
jgi:hypothetical protein